MAGTAFKMTLRRCKIVVSSFLRQFIAILPQKSAGSFNFALFRISLGTDVKVSIKGGQIIAFAMRRLVKVISRCTCSI